MDNLTHTLIGVAVARGFLRRRFGPGTTRILAIASNFPDVDVVTFLFNAQTSFLYRRTLTHSFLGMFLLALLSSWLFKRLFHSLSRRAIFGLSLLGIALHVFFDLLNSFGVVLLYPFSYYRFELAWVFIIDLAMWAILISPFVLSRIIPGTGSGAAMWWRVSTVLLAFYVGLCAAGRSWAMDILHRRADQNGADFVYVFPEPLGNHRFRGLLRRNGEYQLFLIRPFSGQAQFKDIITTAADEAVSTLSHTPAVRKLLWFAKAPVWEKLPDGRYRLYDLRFYSLILRWKPRLVSFEFENPNSVQR